MTHRRGQTKIPKCRTTQLTLPWQVASKLNSLAQVHVRFGS